MYFKVTKRNENAKLPERANLSDAGIDVFYCGEKSIVLKPGTSYLFNTGLSIEIPHGYALIVANRSSMAAKRGVIVGACVLDSGFAGEILIDLHMVNQVLDAPLHLNPWVEIKPGDKIAQLICIPVVHWLPIEVDGQELYREMKPISNRGEGGFGSTGS